MKWLITGGESGLGLELSKLIERDGAAVSLSRRTGHDIKSESGRREIVAKSLDFDVFFNNAFDGPPHKEWADFGQTKLLFAVFDAWKRENKSGYIFNIGSFASQTPVLEFSEHELYRAAKMALDFASAEATEAFYRNEVLFRTTLLRMGRLDTPKSRCRSSWTGNGHSIESLWKIIRTCLDMPRNTCIRNVDLNVNLHWST